METNNATYTEVLHFIRDRALQRLSASGADVKTDGNLHAEMPLLTTGLYDSLGFMELLAELESRFNTEIDFGDHDPVYFTSLGGLARIVADGLGHAPSSEQPPLINASSDYDYAFLRPGHAHWADVARLFAEMYRGFNDQGLALHLVEGGAEIWLDQVGKSSQGMQCIIGCIKADELVGFLHGAVRVLPPHLAGRFACSIEAVFVQRSHRRRNIAAELVRLAENWFASKGASRTELQVLVGNENGRAFWEHAGFRSELLQMVKEAGR